MLSEAQLADLRARNPVSLIAERLGAVLKKRGRALMGTCPMCGGGRSAQRFEVKGEAGWACAVCADGGDVIRLVERSRGCSFLDAVEWLGGAAEISPAEAARRERELAAKRAAKEAGAAKYREAERRRLFEIWKHSWAMPGTPVEAYLRGRGIDWLDGVIVRYLPEAKFFDGEAEDERGRKVPRLVWTGPAMLTPGVGANGKFRGLHFTWIDPDRPGEKARIPDPDWREGDDPAGRWLNPKKMRGSKAGGWYKVTADPVGARLKAGEGIETTLSSRAALGGAGGWAFRVAGDLGNLGGPATETVPHPTKTTKAGRAERVPGPEPDLSRPALPVPDSVEDLDLIADGDSDPFLTRLAMTRAGKRYAMAGRRVTCTWPPEGADLNDVARGKA